MRPLVDLEIASRTHPGQVRSHNEDSISSSIEYGFAVLADGMGGYNAGEVASGMATAVLKSDLEADLSQWYKELTAANNAHRLHTLIQARVTRANTSIYNAAQSQPQYAGMGTTLVLALFHGNAATIAHIGDSRCYRLRNTKFAQITRDHSLLQEQLDAGLITPEQAEISQNKNLVTKALGVDPAVDAEIHDHVIEAGDVYLLCSDGLSDMVSDQDIGETLLSLSVNLELAADRLIELANQNGGRDNVSVILVKVKQINAGGANAISRFINWLK